MKADLHTHTSISDCNLSQEQVISLAKEKGVSHLAITDHDTVKGLGEAVKLGGKYGVEVIPGVEISAYDFNHNNSCHIVGLYVPTDNKKLEEFVSKIRDSLTETSNRQIHILKENGYDIELSDFDNIENGSAIYKQHIMDVLVKKGYADQIFGEKYKELFFEGGICHMNIECPDACEAVKVLKEVGAFPILAHPSAYDNLVIVEELVACGLMGIEGVYSSCTKEDRVKIEDLSKRYDLVITGGSDFHGGYDHNQSKVIGDYTVDASVVDEIKRRLHK